MDLKLQHPPDLVKKYVKFWTANTISIILGSIQTNEKATHAIYRVPHLFHYKLLFKCGVLVSVFNLI